MIYITEKASEWILKKSKMSGNNENYFIWTLEKSGCSGFSYVFYETSQPKEDIEMIKSYIQDGKTLIIGVEKKYRDYFNNATLDLKKKGLNQNLDWDNPNIKAHCGCGESINF